MLTTTQKKNLKTWIKALRSGKFRQTKSQLAAEITKKNGFGTQIGHCCLGVAKVVVFGDDPHNINYKTALSRDECALLGIDCRSDQDRLMRMNDRGNKRFKQIADYIEKNILKAK